LFFHVLFDRIPLGEVERGGGLYWIGSAVLSNQNRAMKISLLTAVMVAGLATVVLGSPADTELKALEQQWLDAYVKADTAFLKTIEAEDWMLVDGAITNKAKDIKELGDKTFVCKSASMSDIKVKAMGDNAAYATGMVKMAGTYKGKEFSSDFRAVDIFEKKDGKWQAVYSQITKIDKDDKD
jgi:ketosteroid isomerase-like protein